MSDLLRSTSVRLPSSPLVERTGADRQRRRKKFCASRSKGYPRLERQAGMVRRVGHGSGPARPPRRLDDCPSRGHSLAQEGTMTSPLSAQGPFRAASSSLERRSDTRSARAPTLLCRRQPVSTHLRPLTLERCLGRRTLDLLDPLDPGSLHSLESLGFGPFFAAQRALLDRPDLVPARIAGEAGAATSCSAAAPGWRAERPAAPPAVRPGAPGGGRLGGGRRPTRDRATSTTTSIAAPRWCAAPPAPANGRRSWPPTPTPSSS